MLLTSQNRNKQSFPVDHLSIDDLKLKVLQWLRSCSTFSFLDNNSYNNQPNRYELLVGANAASVVEFEALNRYHDQWMFGQLDFEFHNSDSLCHIFIPETVIYITHDDLSRLHVESFLSPQIIFDQIFTQDHFVGDYKLGLKDWRWNIEHSDYINAIRKIKTDILNGAYYEINYCVKCTHEVKDLDPFKLFIEQKKNNPAPFSALMRMEDDYIICASPERFLYKSADVITSQPIKGTIKRSQNCDEDILRKDELYNSIKDRAENVMIVDLTRNDLYRCCQPHSVQVPELFGIYTFPFVHQMISTITGRLKNHMSFSDVIKLTYPMGSMTGAPKKAVVEHITSYEIDKRHKYSGTIFYISPDGDFDSNVVIRSLFYNSQVQVLSFYTGGAITYDSTPEGEWNEILTKSQSMRNI